jgi:tRNA (guanine37-N1)-methyltransferase
MTQEQFPSRTQPEAFWQAHVLTLFPDMFPGPLGHSLAGQAMSAGIWSVRAHDIREHGLGRHRTVDDTPAGGGAGMVMRADVLGAAIDAVRRDAPADLPILYMSPRGERFSQAKAQELAAGPGVIILAGRFEGIDERVIEARRLVELSIGDYVLSGGEIAAMAVLDACVRLLPGVMGKEASLTEESFQSGLLEYPQYTRPRVWEGRSIPDVLLSGDHKRIADWRRAEALRLTTERRPDLIMQRPKD